MKGDSLGPRARALLDASSKVEPGLDGDAKSRMRRSLLGAIGTGAVVTTSAAAAGASTKAVAAGGSVVLAKVGIAVAVVAAIAAGEVARRSLAVPAPPRVVPVEVRRPTASAKVVALPPTAAPVADVVELPPPPAERPLRPTKIAAPSTAKPPTPAPSTEGPKEPHPLATDDEAARLRAFEGELRAIDRARAAEAAGDHEGALAELAGEGAAFREERAALHILALCGSGRHPAGLRELETFRARFPRSLQTERVVRACVTDPQ